MPKYDERQVALVKKVLGTPDTFPEEFKSWLSQFITSNPNLKLDQSALPTLDAMHYVDVSPGFTNSWVNYDAAGFQRAGFFKDLSGVVHVQGLIKSGTMSAAAFTLPPGYRPINYAHFATISNGAFGGCRIDAAGQVIPVEGSNVWFNLDGISFRAK